jgi:hypothetical protein
LFSTMSGRFSPLLSCGSFTIYSSYIWIYDLFCVHFLIGCDVWMEIYFVDVGSQVSSTIYWKRYSFHCAFLQSNFPLYEMGLFIYFLSHSTNWFVFLYWHHTLMITIYLYTWNQHPPILLQFGSFFRVILLF